MSACSEASGRPLRVIQCLRAPLGGLFRHVTDLTRGLAARGVEVGILTDCGDYGELERERLRALGPLCALGVHSTVMPRRPAPRDAVAAADLRRLAVEFDADIVHGHGAKGGAYARLAARFARARALYTPHGGALHYTSTTPSGFLFIALERLLRRLGAPVLFESAFARAAYETKIGEPPDGSEVIHNGLDAAEFTAVEPDADAADVVFLGELRTLKGVFVLAEALERLNAHGRVTAELIGRGPDAAALARQIGRTVEGRVTIRPPMPARCAFARGRLLAVPSLAESLPYAVLEAAAAAVPMVATRAGGIPEIFGPMADALVEPGDPEALAQAIAAALDDPEGARSATSRLRNRVGAHFAQDRMVDAILARYHAALAPSGAATAVPLPHHPG